MDLLRYSLRLYRLQRWRNGIEFLAVESVAEGSKAIQAPHHQEFHVFRLLTTVSAPSHANHLKCRGATIGTEKFSGLIDGCQFVLHGCPRDRHKKSNLFSHYSLSVRKDARFNISGCEPDNHRVATIEDGSSV